MIKNNRIFQGVWGFALALMGIGVFFRIPQIMANIEKIEQFYPISIYIRFCFYFMGVLLVGGGSKKIYDNYIKLGDKSPNGSLDNG